MGCPDAKDHRIVIDPVSTKYILPSKSATTTSSLSLKPNTNLELETSYTHFRNLKNPIT